MTGQIPSGPDFTPPPRQQPATWPAPEPGQVGWAPQRQPGHPVLRQSAAQPPSAPRRRRRWPLALGLAVVVAGVGAGAFAPSLVSRPAAAPASAPTAVPLVTVSPAAQPTARTVLTTGGDLGAPARFTASTGTGTLTITAATWTQAGRMAPPDGTTYLIVEATVTCASGELDVSSLSLRITTQPAEQSTFGANLSGQFPGVRLSAGEKQSGQVGFALRAGTVTVALLDPATLRPVASRVVPGP